MPDDSLLSFLLGVIVLGILICLFATICQCLAWLAEKCRSKSRRDQRRSVHDVEAGVALTALKATPKVQLAVKESKNEVKVNTLYPSLKIDPESIREVTISTLNFYREKGHCLRSSTLFKDPEFPAEMRSLCFDNAPQGHVEWLRPHEIVRDPHFFVDGESRFDVCQGELGDCWLLAAMATLTLHPELFYRVVPTDQSFTTGYAGIFHFRFWRYGEWVDVVIDDRLPTVNGQLIYMRSATRNEFWSALLEKAYAKLFGCYECLEGGLSMEALVDLTGGLTECHYPRQMSPDKCFESIYTAFKTRALFCAAITDNRNPIEKQVKRGLFSGHAYSITGIQKVQTTSGQVILLRIRNPWGNDKEWTGAWSDKSPLWKTVSTSIQTKLQLAIKDDGEFWMSLNDFMSSFNLLEVCHLSALSSEDKENVKNDQEFRKCNEAHTHGKWTAETAGGSAKYTTSFHKNPQFLLNLGANKKKNEKCRVVVALMQKHRRELRPKGQDHLQIGFNVYKLENQDQMRLGERHLRTNQPVASFTRGTIQREVATRFSVLSGDYVIVPFTTRPAEKAEFLIRAFADVDVQIKELK